MTPAHCVIEPAANPVPLHSIMTPLPVGDALKERGKFEERQDRFVFILADSRRKTASASVIVLEYEMRLSHYTGLKEPVYHYRLRQKN